VSSTLEGSAEWPAEAKDLAQFLFADLSGPEVRADPPTEVSVSLRPGLGLAPAPSLEAEDLTVVVAERPFVPQTDPGPLPWLRTWMLAATGGMIALGGVLFFVLR